MTRDTAPAPRHEFSAVRLPRNPSFIFYAMAYLLAGLVFKFLGQRGPLEGLVDSVSRTLGHAT